MVEVPMILIFLLKVALISVVVDNVDIIRDEENPDLLDTMGLYFPNLYIGMVYALH